DAGAERCNQRADFLRRQHLVETRALDVQNLAAQRKNGLIFAIASLFRGAAGRIALDDEEFSLGGIAFLTIRQFARQIGYVARALAAREFARLARRLARVRGLDDLGDDV